MAITNAPGAGQNWPEDAANLDAPDDHGGGGGVNPAAIKAGHEPDAFVVKPILSIPAAVVFTFVVAFACTTAVFVYMMAVPTDPNANPLAVKANEAPTDARLARIDRKGSDGNPDVKADNARLEPLRQLENNGQTITQPPLPDGYNSPEIHPEDINPALRPSMVPALQETGKLPDGATHITITDAMSLATGPLRAAVLPTRKNPVKLVPSGSKPTGANAGRGELTPAPTNGEAPKKEVEKH